MVSAVCPAQQCPTVAKSLHPAAGADRAAGDAVGGCERVADGHCLEGRCAAAVSARLAWHVPTVQGVRQPVVHTPAC